MQSTWQRIGFRVLGPLQALAGQDPIPLGGPKQRILLACLLLRRGEFVPREELVDTIWGEAPPESAVASLQVYVHGLRRALAEERIETGGTAYRIRIDDSELDLASFERLLADGRHWLNEGQTELAVAALQEALHLWQGPALSDLPSDTLMAERARLDELRVAGLELLAEAELARGDHQAVVSQLATLVAEHPYRERLYELQILALYRAGRQKDALEAYRQARRVLVEELGIEPGPRLKELETAILRQEPTLDPPQAQPRQETRATVAVVVLPAPPTKLIGREREVAEVLTLMRDDGARLVTLTGPGGTGKTRLAIAVAQQLGPELRDGARFIDLSAISEPALVLPTIAAELGVQPGARPLAADVAEHLRPLNMLLVLDNLERLLPTATDLADLLTAAPELVMLATSRTCLRLRAEHEYQVPPLWPPGPEAGFESIAGNDAVRLLAERARAVNRAFSLTEDSAADFAHICRRLDGLPLAIELAASRMRSLSPQAVAAGLDRALELLVEGPRDLPVRQQTLRATLDWSHELLGEPEQRVFACLAAFAGSFNLRAVEAVAGLEAAAPLDMLVEANLVRRLESGRYAMLETIREYAADCLGASGRSEIVYGAHCRYFVDLAEQAYETTMTGEQRELGYRLLEQEQPNLRAALEWASRTDALELEVRLACALRQFWIIQGQLAEGRAVFERLVAATEGGEPALRARALMHGGPFPYRQGELAQAAGWWEEAMALLEDLGETEGAARCAGELGAVAFSEGDLARAARLYEQSAHGFTELGDRLRLGIVNANLAEVLALGGELPRAIHHAEQAVAIDRELGDPDGLPVALHTLARLRHKAGQPDAAQHLFAECLACALAIGYREIIANCVQAAADLSLMAGRDPETAARLLTIARATLADIGVRLQGLEAESFAHTEDQLAAKLGRERLEALEREAGEASLEAAAEEAVRLLEAEPLTRWRAPARV